MSSVDLKSMQILQRLFSRPIPLFSTVLTNVALANDETMNQHAALISSPLGLLHTGSLAHLPIYPHLEPIQCKGQHKIPF